MTEDREHGVGRGGDVHHSVAAHAPADACVCGETSTRNCPAHAPLDVPVDESGYPGLGNMTHAQATAAAQDWPMPGDDDHISAFDGTLADGLDDEPAAFRCIPDESGGLADTPWVYCAGCGRTVAALERAGGWWCAGCGERLGFQPVVDRDPGDEQPEAAA